MVRFPDKSLIDELLDEQRQLTAVDRFAQKHERAEMPLQNRYYRDLLPLNSPRPGEQYAFEVDLDQCSGCKACVVACHRLNGLEPGESWRSTGLLVAQDGDVSSQQTLTTACHHCFEPACLDGCPALAYEKDATTGIVRHLDDQCIGCQYCILKCPYEVPQYSSRLGIVRKCDLCGDRLRAGEAPACVQACPNSAIRITIVADVPNPQRENGFPPSCPDPDHTRPATRYRSARGLPKDLRAADERLIAPASPHWPLVGMLLLTQAGVGAIVFELIFALSIGSTDRRQASFGAGLGLAGIIASVFHLGRPFQAWRAVLGARRSWLSREIIALGFLAPALLFLLAGYWRQSSMLPALIYAAMVGVIALVCSMMVYIDTPREFWGWRQTVPRFSGAAIVLGAALSAFFHPEHSAMFALTALCAVAKFGFELGICRHLSDASLTPLKRTALLLAGPLAGWSLFRSAALAVSALIFAAGSSRPVILAAIVLLFSGEIAERLLYFRAVAQPKMPGGPS